MDARAVTSALVTLALLAAIVLLILFGGDLLGLDQKRVQSLMLRVSESPMALFGVILVYCALAMTGFPQAILIAGTVAVFGVAKGVPYSWIATMCSATLTFSLGHAFGGRFVRKLSAGRALTMIEVMRKRGGIASGVVRVTPSAPFIVVNAVCGAAHVPLWKFWLGTGIGILPKILFLSFFTDQVDELVGFFSSRNAGDLGVIALLIAAWVAFLLFVRYLYMRLRKSTLSGLSD
jgi:uncharacterized membrane protein YdjX (TVP38/TMEM64 family)